MSKTEKLPQPPGPGRATPGGYRHGAVSLEVESNSPGRPSPMDKTKPCSFPIDGLPEAAGIFFSALAARYGVSPSVTTLACLAVTGAAAGKSIRVERYPGAVPISAVLNVVLAAQHSPAVSTMVAELFGPLIQFQARDGEPFGGASRFTRPDPDWLRQREARLVLERQRYLGQAVYPDPDHLAHFDEPLFDLRLARPLALVNPPPGQIAAASHGGFDQAVSVVTTVAGATTRLVDHWTTDEGTAELELMAAGWHHRPVYEIDGDGRLGLSALAPCLSLILVASWQDRIRLLTAPEFVGSGVAATLLVADPGPDDAPASSQPLAPAYQQTWKANLEALWCWRKGGRVWTCRPADPAREILNRFSQEIVKLSARLSAPHLHLAAPWIEQCWRLALLLHVVEGKANQPINPRTAEAAVALTHWLIGQQMALVEASVTLDPVQAFVRGQLAAKPEAWLTVSDGYTAYITSCRDGGFPVLSRNAFRGAVAAVIEEQFGLRLRNDVPGANGKPHTGWKGLARRASSTSGAQDAPDLNHPDHPIDFLI